MRSVLAGWRLALRLARREAVRRKGQTALMLVLISLPVLAVGAAAVVWQTSEISGVERLDRTLGAADALVRGSDVAGPVAQHFDPEVGIYGGGDESAEAKPAPVTPRDLRRVLGERPVARIGVHWLSYKTDKGLDDVVVDELDLGDPLTEGLFRPVAGRFVPGPGQVIVNEALAARGPGIGDDLVLSNESGDEVTLRVVGIAESASVRGSELAVTAPGALGSAVDETRPAWLVGGGPVDWDQVRQLNQIGAVVTSRAVITDPPPRSELPPEALESPSSLDDTTLTVLVLVVVMVLLEVVLLAGPAFAVRARKQSYALALISAAGGTPAQARRVVLATGVVVGVAGGVIGVTLGIGVGYLMLPVAQRLNEWEYLGPFDVPWRILAVVAAFGLISALSAAVVPAWLASRQNVVAVLAGRRGEGRPSARSPIVGLVLLGIGVTAAVIGARDRGIAPALIGGSAIVSVLGMILLVSVVVVLVSRLAARLPLALRFAARDAARHRSRTVPAVAAVAATVSGVVALGIAISSQEAASRASYVPQMPMGEAAVTLGTHRDLDDLEKIVAARLPEATFRRVDGVRTDGDGRWIELTFRSDGRVLEAEQWGWFGSYVAATRVPAFVELSTADRRRANGILREGGIVMLTGTNNDEPVPIEAATVTAREHAESGGKPVRAGRAKAAATWVTVNGPAAPAQALMPPSVISRLGLTTVPMGLAVTGEFSDAAEKDIAEALAALPGHPSVYVERGYEADPAIRVVQWILAVLGAVLMLGGTLTATFLALSDARPDLATMAAVGARPRTRRTVAASYALVVGMVGAVLGAPVGFIPGIAISGPLTMDWETGATHRDIPWLLITAVVVGLPFLTAGVVGLCARSRLPMVARID